MKYTTILFCLILTSLLLSCSKETEMKEDIETGLLCEPDFEVNYSEWCINNFYDYHIGYPNIACYDSMLVSFPKINNGVDIYGNYPFNMTFLTFDYFSSVDLHRINTYDCTDGEDYVRFLMFIEDSEFQDPTSVNVLFYFYNENGGLPIDSSYVEFKPWEK